MSGPAETRPVRGSRYPRIPGFGTPVAVWLQRAGTAITQHMHIKSSFVTSFRLLSQLVIELYFLGFNARKDFGGICPVFPAQFNTKRNRS